MTLLEELEIELEEYNRLTQKMQDIENIRRRFGDEIIRLRILIKKEKSE